MAHIELRALERDYGDFRMGPVSATLEDGSFTVLLGPSGSGKSTLLRLLAGLETPEAGAVALDGRDVTRVPAEERGIGLVFQDGALFPHLNVAENVAFGLRVQRVHRVERIHRVDEALRLVGMEDKGDRRVSRLSGGERQRVALARALAPRPSVLLLDEPLASLDRNLRDELRSAIRRLHDELSLTTVLVTHDREEALTLADRLLVLRAGSLVEEGTPRELFDHPQTGFAARFLGAANVLPQGAWDVLVRPDDVRVEPDPDGDARVSEVRFAGFHEDARVALDDGTVLDVHAAVGTLPRPGTRVKVSWDPARARRVPRA